MSNFVYLIEAVGTGLYKVGVATDLKNRITILQTGCPYKLRLVHACTPDNPFAIERQFHSLMQRHRVIGEWFRLSDADVKQLTVYMSLPLDTDEDVRESVIQSLELDFDMDEDVERIDDTINIGIRVGNKLREKLAGAKGDWIRVRDLVQSTFSQPKDRIVARELVSGMIESGDLESYQVENPNKTVSVMIRLKSADLTDSN